MAHIFACVRCGKTLSKRGPCEECRKKIKFNPDGTFEFSGRTPEGGFYKTVVDPNPRTGRGE